MLHTLFLSCTTQNVVDKGLSVNEADAAGNTPLHHAAMTGMSAKVLYVG